MFAASFGTWPLLGAAIVVLLLLSWCDYMCKMRRAQRAARGRRVRGHGFEAPSAGTDDGAADSLDILARELAAIDKRIDELTSAVDAAETADEVEGVKGKGR